MLGEPEEALIKQIELQLGGGKQETEKGLTTQSGDESTDGETPDEVEASAEVEEAEAPDEEAADSPEVLTAERLAKHLEIPEAELLEAFQVKDSQGNLVPLSKALAAFHAPAPEKAEYEKVSARARELEASETERKQQFDAGMGNLQQITLTLLKQLQGEEEPNWDALRSSNPTEYLIQRREWDEKRGRIRASIDAQRQYGEQLRAQEAEKFEVYRREQAVKLQSSVPEWKDASKFKTDLEGIESYLQKQGFAPEEIRIVDHREWLLARKAMLFDAMPSQGDVLKKRLANVPKLVRPGVSGNPRSLTSSKTQDAAMAKLRKSGSVDDAAAAYLATRKVLPRGA